jgi:hypothetical protein
MFNQPFIAYGMIGKQFSIGYDTEDSIRRGGASLVNSTGSGMILGENSLDLPHSLSKP